MMGLRKKSIGVIIEQGGCFRYLAEKRPWPGGAFSYEGVGIEIRRDQVRETELGVSACR